MLAEGYLQTRQEVVFVTEEKAANIVRPPKLLDRLREALRSRHYSRRTEETYCHNEILVRDGKGVKDRITLLPESLKIPLLEHLKRVKAIHERDLSEGWSRVQMPDALERKYPNAPNPCPQPWTGGCSQSGGRALSQSRRLYCADPHKMP